MALTTVQAGILATPAQYTAMKNRIINGAMVIDQRNAGASVSVVSGTSPYTLDRYVAYNNSTNTYTVQQSSTAPAGFSKSLVFTNNASATSNTAGMYQLLGQRIEGYNTADLNWGTANAKTFTVSFWAYTSQAGTYGGVLRNGANTRFYGFSFTLTANTWTQVTTTVAGDTSGAWATDNTTGIELLICLSCGSSFTGSAGSWGGTQVLGITGQTQFNATAGATFYITGVQLEVGSSATGYEYRQYQQELALCQRYLPAYNASAGNSVLSSGYAYATTNAAGIVVFPVPTRAPPTGITVSSASILNFNSVLAYTASAIAFSSASTTSASIILTITAATAGQGGQVFFNAAGQLLFTGCEL